MLSQSLNFLTSYKVGTSGEAFSDAHFVFCSNEGKKAVKGKLKPKEDKLKPSDDELKSATCEILKEVDFDTVRISKSLQF